MPQFITKGSKIFKVLVKYYLLLFMKCAPIKATALEFIIDPFTLPTLFKKKNS